MMLLLEVRLHHEVVVVILTSEWPSLGHSKVRLHRTVAVSTHICVVDPT